jgi:hypothetical protein
LGDLKIMNTLRSSIITGPVAGLVTLVLAGCGGSSASNPAPTTYTIGGVVIGLNSSSTVTIAYGASTALSATTDGPFTLPTMVQAGTAYTVAVGTSPSGQTCGVQNGAGTVEGNVTDLFVYCTDNVTAATLNGTYDLASLNINNDADQLFTAVPFNGSGTQGSSTVTGDQAGTTFPTSTDSGGPYTVTTAVALPVLTSGANTQGAIAGADGDEFYWITNLLNANGTGPALVFGVKPLQTATTASLAGTWTTVGLTQAGATPYDSEESLTINADGSFSGTQSTLNVSGTASGAQAISGPTGSFSVTNNIVSAGGNSGYISENGEFVILTFVMPQVGGVTANYPDLTVAIKQGTGVTLATVNGIYSIGSLGFDTASTGEGESFTLFFDGQGDFDGTYAENANGVSSNSGGFSGTYTVTSSGGLTLTDTNGAVYPGAVSADGNLMVAATLTAGGTEAPQMFAGFRQ